MGGSSKELLMLEKESSASAAFQSSLLVCERRSSASISKVDEKLVTAPIPQSQVLGKVRDFLGVFSEANRQLQRDSKDNCKKYDIEALTGNESEVIEMDLMLGVAELRSQQALEAAEAALAGAQPLTRFDGSESDSSDDDVDDESSSQNSNDDESNMKDASKLGEEDGSSRVDSKRRPKKQPKIIEISM